MENKYGVGEVVFALENPKVLLTVRRYVDRIYYCRSKDPQTDKDLVYFERELNSPKKA
jgi:hypothetical protein